MLTTSLDSALINQLLQACGIPLGLGPTIRQQLGCWVSETREHWQRVHKFRLEEVSSEIDFQQRNKSAAMANLIPEVSAQALALLEPDEWDAVLDHIQAHHYSQRTLADLRQIWSADAFTIKPHPYTNSGEVLWVALRGDRASLVVVSKAACESHGGFNRSGLVDCRPVTRSMLDGLNPPIPVPVIPVIPGLDLSELGIGHEPEQPFNSLFPVDEWHPVNHPTVGWAMFFVGAQRTNDLYLWMGDVPA